MEMNIRRKSLQVEAKLTPHQPCLYSDPFRNNHKRGVGSFQKIHNRFFLYIYRKDQVHLSIRYSTQSLIARRILYRYVYRPNFEDLTISSNPELFSVVYQKKIHSKNVQKSIVMHDLTDKSN